MKILFIVNDAPYGTEKAYDALRMAMMFLMADAATCALPNQATPQGYYNIERMLKSVINQQRRASKGLRWLL